MDRLEALGDSFSKKGLVRAAKEGFLYDYIAQWYWQMTKDQLKDVLLEVLYTAIESASGIDEKEYNERLLDNLAERGFGLDD